MTENQTFNPQDYLDGGKKKFDGKDYASLKWLDGEKIKQIALARIAARKEEAVTIERDKLGALQVVALMNPFDNTNVVAPVTPAINPNTPSSTAPVASYPHKERNKDTTPLNPAAAVQAAPLTPTPALAVSEKWENIKNLTEAYKPILQNLKGFWLQVRTDDGSLILQNWDILIGPIPSGKTKLIIKNTSLSKDFSSLTIVYKEVWSNTDKSFTVKKWPFIREKIRDSEKVEAALHLVGAKIIEQDGIFAIIKDPTTTDKVEYELNGKVYSLDKPMYINNQTIDLSHTWPGLPGSQLFRAYNTDPNPNNRVQDLVIRKIPKKNIVIDSTATTQRVATVAPTKQEKVIEEKWFSLSVNAQKEFKKLWVEFSPWENGSQVVKIKDGKIYDISIKSNTLNNTYDSKEEPVEFDSNTKSIDFQNGKFLITNKDGSTEVITFKEKVTAKPRPDPTLTSVDSTRKVESLAIRGDLYDIGVQVFEKLRKPGESISFSPTSLQQVLYVYTLSHSQGELAAKLGFTGTDKTKFEALLKTLNAPDAKPFKSVNAVFSKIWTFGNEKLMKDLSVELGKINPNDIPWETQRLNKFVSDKTNWMIKDLFTARDVSSAQEIFVNTIYFKWDWASKFNESLTQKDQKFGDKKADLMSQTDNFSSLKTETSTALRMPFHDGSSMIAFLPDNNLSDTIKDVTKLLKTPSSLNFWAPTKTYVTFPKFETESTGNGIGSMLGLGVDVIQKSKVIVNEQWAEAAAATAGISRGVFWWPIIKFDKPFFYAIQDKAGNIHFMGTYEGK